MTTAAKRTLYFILFVVFAVVAACATPGLLVQGPTDDPSVALDNWPFSIDARMSQAR